MTIQQMLLGAKGAGGASWVGPVTSNYFGSSGTSSVTTNLYLPSAITNTDVKISYIEIAGDTNSTSETVTISMVGTSDTVYGGNQSTTYFQATKTNGGATNFNNRNISNYLNGSPGSYYLSVTSSCASSVGSFVFGNDRYRVRLVLDNA